MSQSNDRDSVLKVEGIRGKPEPIAPTGVLIDQDEDPVAYVEQPSAQTADLGPVAGAGARPSDPTLLIQRGVAANIFPLINRRTDVVCCI